MAVHAIEWQISLHLLGPDRTNWEQVMDHFVKVRKGLHSRLNHSNPYCIMCIIVLIV